MVGFGFFSRMCVFDSICWSAFHASKKYLTNILQAGNQLVFVVEVLVSPGHIPGSTVMVESIHTWAAQL